MLGFLDKGSFCIPWDRRGPQSDGGREQDTDTPTLWNQGKMERKTWKQKSLEEALETTLKESLDLGLSDRGWG